MVKVAWSQRDGMQFDSDTTSKTSWFEDAACADSHGMFYRFK